MSKQQLIAAGEVTHLARVLPYPILVMLADFTDDTTPGDWAGIRHRLTGAVGHANYRALIGAWVDRWRADAPIISPPDMAFALRTATLAEKAHQEEQSVELVWTGPDVGATTFRKTEQALLQVINSAKERVLVVSYAVYNIPLIREALVEAARRGVHISVVVETPDRMEGQSTYSTLVALGKDVAKHASVYYWPPVKRQASEGGKRGILHVKCAVSDGRLLFLTSANLTEYAFTINMELGVLVTGGGLPKRIERHFDAMIKAGILESP